MLAWSPPPPPAPPSSSSSSPESDELSLASSPAAIGAAGQLARDALPEYRASTSTNTLPYQVRVRARASGPVEERACESTARGTGDERCDNNRPARTYASKRHHLARNLYPFVPAILCSLPSAVFSTRRRITPTRPTGCHSTQTNQIRSACTQQFGDSSERCDARTG